MEKPIKFAKVTRVLGEFNSGLFMSSIQAGDLCIFDMEDLRFCNSIRKLIFELKRIEVKMQQDFQKQNPNFGSFSSPSCFG